MDIVLRPGWVRVTGHDVVIDNPDVKIVEVDVDSKHPGNPTFFYEEDDLVVILPVAEHTSNLDLLAGRETTVTFRGAHEWTVITEASRYNVIIVVYRPGARS